MEEKGFTTLKEDLMLSIVSLDNHFKKGIYMDFNQYSFIRNLILSITYILETFDIEMVQAYNNIWIATANEEGLERYLLEEGLEWNEGTRSSVKVKIGSKNIPTKTITIPTLFQVGTSDSKIFETTEEVILNPSTPQTVIRTGTAQGGGNAYIILDSSAREDDSYYNNYTIQINSGTGAGQINTISSYIGSTKTAYVINNWDTNPDDTSVFSIKDDNYTVEVETQSKEIGTIYNVSEKTITEILTSLDGVDYVMNFESASGGTDREDIESVRDRLLEKQQVFDRGTEDWFISNAKSFSFVKDAFVVAAPEGNGTVNISIAGNIALTVLQIQEVQDYFDDESIKSMGAFIPIVTEVTSIDIDITIIVYRLNDTVTNTIITNAITSFFQTEMGVGDDFILYNFIKSIMNISGVYNLSMTTPTSDITIDSNQTGSIGLLNITLIDV